MSDPNDIQQKPTPTRRARRRMLWLGGFVGGLLLLLLAGAIYESLSEAADARAYPPPGQMVDVGGHRLHINCAGTGSPVVVIDAGLGDWSTSWGFVQPQVAKITRVCTYDRAGMGWSEPVRSQGMQVNLPKSCTRCCTMQIFQGPIYWSGTRWEVCRFACSRTTTLRKLRA